jgi:hypothetical protein
MRRSLQTTPLMHHSQSHSYPVGYALHHPTVVDRSPPSLWHLRIKTVQNSRLYLRIATYTASAQGAPSKNGSIVATSTKNPPPSKLSSIPMPAMRKTAATKRTSKYSSNNSPAHEHHRRPQQKLGHYSHHPSTHHAQVILFSSDSAHHHHHQHRQRQDHPILPATLKARRLQRRREEVLANATAIDHH